MVLIKFLCFFPVQCEDFLRPTGVYNYLQSYCIDVLRHPTALLAGGEDDVGRR